VQVPQEGLIEVPHDSAEYWDVVEQFKKPPNTETAQGNTDRKGMHDAWWEDRLLFLSNVSCHIDSKRSFCPDRLGTNTTKVEQRLFSAGTRVTKLQRIQSELALDPSAQKDNDTTNHKSSPFRLFLQLLLTWHAPLTHADPDLFTYFDSQKRRIAKTPGAKDAKGEVIRVKGWHGTSSFPAQNIYLDKQDGFM
jgi:hypothetical protein